jgi:hypothetical protein
VSILKNSILLCTAFFLLAGCRQSRVDFSGGKYAFLSVDESPPGAAGVDLSLVPRRGAQAVRAELTGAGTPYIVIDASSLLGKDVSRLRTMELTLGLEREDGEFYAVSGEIRAYSGAERRESADRWSVYLAEKNPNIARAVLDEGEYFVPAADNFFILSRKLDNAVEAGKDPSALIISRIRFLDEQGKELKINPNGVFHPPRGFGQRDRSNLLAFENEYNLERANGTSKGGWGQAVVLDTAKNGGKIDPALFTDKSALMVYYSAETPPELILQSWTEGAPPSAGWAKVAPAAVNNSASCTQYLVADMIKAFGTADFSTYLDKLYVGDTGTALEVFTVSVAALK